MTVGVGAPLIEEGEGVSASFPGDLHTDDSYGDENLVKLRVSFLLWS